MGKLRHEKGEFANQTATLQMIKHSSLIFVILLGFALLLPELEMLLYK